MRFSQAISNSCTSFQYLIRIDPRNTITYFMSGVLVFVFILSGILMGFFHIFYQQTNAIFLLGAIIFMSFPVLLFMFTSHSEKRYQEYTLLGLICLSAVFNRYIFAFLNPFTVGTDAPFHIFYSQQFANGIWPDSDGVSSSMPLLYLIYGAIARTTNIPVNMLATWFHPALNIMSIVLFYIYIRGFAPARIALVAIYIYAWEYTSFFFGFEFRTQSLAIIFFAASLAARRVSLETDKKINKIILQIISTAMLVCIALTTVISSLIVAILLAAMSIDYYLEKRKGINSRSNTINAALIVVVVTIFYLIYNVPSVDQILSYLIGVVKNILISESINESNFKGVFVLGYGYFVAILQWLLRFVFVGGIILEIKRYIDHKHVYVAPLISTIVLLGIVAVASPIGGPLSLGRYFQYISPFLGLYSAIFIFFVIDRIRKPRYQMAIRISVAVLLTLWSVSGILKLPAALIDPIEVSEPVPATIDWNSAALLSSLQQRVTDPSSFVCADWDTANTFFALSGIRVDKIIPRDHDFSKENLDECLSNEVYSSSIKNIIITLHITDSDPINQFLLSKSFSLQGKTKTTKVFVRLSEGINDKKDNRYTSSSFPLHVIMMR